MLLNRCLQPNQFFRGYTRFSPARLLFSINKSVSSNAKKKKKSFSFSVISTNPDILLSLGKKEVSLFVCQNIVTFFLWKKLRTIASFFYNYFCGALLLGHNVCFFRHCDNVFLPLYYDCINFLVVVNIFNKRFLYIAFHA